VISAREIADWRVMAPWNTDLTVEQDFLICKAVAAIFEDGFLAGQVAMRGGTVLHNGHLAPASRYSEDIDLVLVGSRPKGHIKRALNRVLSPIFGSPSESIYAKIKLVVRNLNTRWEILRNTYAYSPSSEQAALGHLKVEVNVNEQKSLFPLVNIGIDVPADNGSSRQTVVQSYDVDEMLGTKMRALLQREHGRDLFDLWWAAEHARTHATLRIDPIRVGAAFRFYMAQEGRSFSAAEFENELARRMRSRKFLKDMDDYLPRRRTYDPNLAHRQFLEFFLPHLDPAP
jgi:predicted nucleotidyltransferase component of viral defense system